MPTSRPSWLSCPRPLARGCFFSVLMAPLGLALAPQHADAQTAGDSLPFVPAYAPPPGAPYRAVEVRVPSAAAALGATLTIPCGATDRLPAAVLIAGTGVQDRDGGVMPNDPYRPLRQIADTLSRRGIAVLRLDDRGFAEGNHWSPPTAAEVAEDVRNAISLLRGRADIDAQRILVIGHSEGGIVAPMIAAGDSGLAGIILLSAPAKSWRQTRQELARAAAERDPRLRTAEERDSVASAQLASEEVMITRVRAFGFLADHDPLPAARRVSRPSVLILHGATDQQVPPAHVELLAAAFRAGGNRDVSVRLFPETNHLMVHDPNGDPSGYDALPSRTVTAEVLGALAEWASTRLGARSDPQQSTCR